MLLEAFTQTLETPPNLVGQGFRLRISDQEFELNAESLEIPDEYARVELVDRNGRIVSRDTIYPGWQYKPEMVPWRVGVAFGVISIVRGRAWLDAKLPNFVEENSAFLGHSVNGARRIYAQIDWRATNQILKPSVEHHYDATTYWLGTGYWFAPWGLGADRWLRKIHCHVFASIGFGENRVTHQ